MSEFLDDDRLRAFGAPARVTVWPDADGLLCIGDAETVLRVAERDGWYHAEKQDRGGPWRELMRSEHLAVARRFVLWEIGGWVRSAAARGLASRSPEPSLPGGFTLTDDGDEVALSWTEATGARSARMLGGVWRSKAVRFAAYADLGEEAILSRFGGQSA
ncbi:hypothetical protein [Catellatospora sp. NPDC049609]|uniref:hypothetical protein n=1 Tax=Catellatospora sp. NPDC049609 TaxID=3155505 RepID=UPI00342167BB